MQLPAYIFIAAYDDSTSPAVPFPGTFGPAYHPGTGDQSFTWAQSRITLPDSPEIIASNPLR